MKKLSLLLIVSMLFGCFGCAFVSKPSLPEKNLCGLDVEQTYVETIKNESENYKSYFYVLGHATQNYLTGIKCAALLHVDQKHTTSHAFYVAENQSFHLLVFDRTSNVFIETMIVRTPTTNYGRISAYVTADEIVKLFDDQIHNKMNKHSIFLVLEKAGEIADEKYDNILSDLTNGHFSTKKN